MVGLIKRFILRSLSASQLQETIHSDYIVAKAYKKLVVTLKSYVKDVFLISIGIASAAFGLKGFLLKNGFIDGGATGISLLISEVMRTPLSVLIFLVNLPFVVLSYFTMGKTFFLKTVLAIAGLAVFLAMVDFPNVTKDSLLVAIFGGFFLGAGIGFAVRGGAVIDGTEVLAIFLSRKFGTTIGDIITIINALIFSVAAYLLGVEVALYSMVTYLVASKALDFIVHGLEEYIGVTIVSSHDVEIRQMIIDVMGVGATVYSGKRGYGKTGMIREIEIIYTVVSRLELGKLQTEIEKIDANAFVVMNTLKDTHGGMLKKRKGKLPKP